MSHDPSDKYLLPYRNVVKRGEKVRLFVPGVGRVKWFALLYLFAVWVLFVLYLVVG